MSELDRCFNDVDKVLQETFRSLNSLEDEINYTKGISEELEKENTRLTELVDDLMSEKEELVERIVELEIELEVNL